MNSFRQYRQSLVESSPSGGGGSDTQQQRLSRGDSKGQYSLWTGPQPYLWADPNTPQYYDGQPSSMPEEGWWSEDWLIEPHPYFGGGARYPFWQGPPFEANPDPRFRELTHKEMEKYYKDTEHLITPTLPI